MGEVWCVTLWDARANLIRKYGGTAGNQLMLQLVTDAHGAFTPNPNFCRPAMPFCRRICWIPAARIRSSCGMLSPREEWAGRRPAQAVHDFYWRAGDPLMCRMTCR